MHGKVFDCISELIHTPHHSWGRRMVAVLGSHDTAVSNALDLTQCKLLVSFLQDKDSQVKEWAVGRMYTLTESPGGGQAALDIDVFAVTRLIQSPNMDVRRWTGEILGRLADLDATATTGAISVANLVSSLLHDENFQIIHSAVYTLYKLTKSAQGAQAVINANVLDYTAELLESPEPKVREYMRDYYCGTDENSAISECAAEALYWITETPAGVQAVLNADVLDCVVDLLESHNRNWAKRMLEDHEIHVAEALSTRHSKQHTSFFRETDNKVIKSTVGTLYKITASLEGVQAALDANIFSCLAELLQSPNSDVRGWACQILGGRCHSLHNSGSIAPAVIQSAAYALHKIANSPQGVQAVLDANVLVSVPELLASGNHRVQRWTRGMLKALASHLTTHLSR
ncbi:armadillo-type protein [Mycena vulgaris]|nr:armadillo-type protein [Mycena vulgaris]